MDRSDQSISKAQFSKSFWNKSLSNTRQLWAATQNLPQNKPNLTR